MDIIALLKVIFGSIYVLFLPGFVWSYVFFKKGEIDEIERIALSFGLSIALVPLLTFWMNYLFKVKITAANVSLLILGLIFVGMAIIYLRDRLHPPTKSDI